MDAYFSLFLRVMIYFEELTIAWKSQFVDGGSPPGHELLLPTLYSLLPTLYLLLPTPSPLLGGFSTKYSRGCLPKYRVSQAAAECLC